MNLAKRDGSEATITAEQSAAREALIQRAETTFLALAFSEARAISDNKNEFLLDALEVERQGLEAAEQRVAARIKRLSGER